MFPKFKEEIGILFLGDNLAKTDIVLNVKNDDEIEEQTEKIVKIIKEKGLSSKLLAAIRQRPVSIANAEEYLKFIASEKMG